MVVKLIEWSLENRFLVLLLTAILIAWGVFVIKNTPLDAIPDLSDVQVIIKKRISTHRHGSRHRQHSRR